MNAPPDRLPILRTVLICVAAVLCLYLFLLSGNTHRPDLYGPSILSWLARQWTLRQGEMGHGWLVPLVSLLIVWRKRKELAAAAAKVDARALVIIALCLVMYWTGNRSQQPRLGVLCLIGLCWSVPYYLWGKKVARQLVFPCSYLLFAVPMGFLTAMTLPLRLIACRISAAILNGLGIGTIRQGTALLSTDPGGFALNVADPCSGLQSLIALSALTFVYSYFTQKGLVRRWSLFLLAIPIAMLSNIIRIVVIAVIYRSAGEGSAMKLYHDASGYIVFIAAVILMIAFGTVINRIGRAK